MSPPSSCLIPSPPPSPSAPFLPKPFSSQPQPLQFSRRSAASLSILLSLLSSLHRPQQSLAFSFGISGPKEWLREQKKKTSRFILAPIDASRDILQSAYLLLIKEDSDYNEKDAEQVQTLLSSAGRDCVVQDRNSFVAFQAKTGVEVCTFQLIVNNASSLLADKDPVKLEAEASLNDLIRSFTTLNDLANQTYSSRKKVADALMETLVSLKKFEQNIKDCLEI